MYLYFVDRISAVLTELKLLLWKKNEK